MHFESTQMCFGRFGSFMRLSGICGVIVAVYAPISYTHWVVTLGVIIFNARLLRSALAWACVLLALFGH